MWQATDASSVDNTQMQHGNQQQIFRMKGILNISNDSKPHYLQAVQQLYEIQPSDRDRWEIDIDRHSRVVVIGRYLDVKGLERGLHACSVV